jgi:hypothetical protein
MSGNSRLVRSKRAAVEGGGGLTILSGVLIVSVVAIIGNV